MDNILGYNLRKYREKNNLTQKEFAAQLGISRTALTGYENGKNFPTSIVLISMAKGMNCSIDNLLGYNITNSTPLSFNADDTTTLKEKILYLDNLIDKTLKTYNDLIDAKRRTNLKFNEILMSKKRIDRILKELTMSNKRNDLTHDELTRTINRLVKTQDLFKEATESFFNAIEIENKSNDNLHPINELNTPNNNEVTATLETNTSSSDNIVSLESYRDDKDFDLEYEQYLTREEDIDNNKYRSIPLSGPVAAGSPREPIECIEGYYNIPTNKLKSHCDYFLLRVDGDSMNKLYEKNDIILVRKQSFSDDGELVVAFLRDYGATFKRYYNNNGNVELHPESTNPIHKTQIYSPDEAFILGVVLGSLREYVD